MIFLRPPLLVAGAVAVLASSVFAQTSSDGPASRRVHTGKAAPVLPLKFAGKSTSAAITPGDLMTRVYKFADDSMMGREAGTKWNDKGTDYLASELRRLGIRPAGDNGSYFQSALARRLIADDATLGVGDTSYTLWKDFAPRDQGDAATPFDGATPIFGGTFGDTATYLPPAAAAGKVVVFKVGRGRDGTPDFNLVNRFALSSIYRSAAAIAVTQLDLVPPGYVDATYRSGGVSEKGMADAEPRASYFYITKAVAEAMFGVPFDSLKTGMEGRAVRGRYAVREEEAPGRNVIGILEGSDPALKGQYIAIGSHNDHVGFTHEPVDHDSVYAFLRVAATQGADSPPTQPTEVQWARIRAIRDSLRAVRSARPDSIYNGADDDGSGSMSVLEIAEAFARQPLRPKRSILFIWHVGEELGLFGSEYFTDHPTVPRDSIIAELNMDMVGRGGADDVTGVTKDGKEIRGGAGYVQLVGSRRLSTELGNLVERVNVDRKLGLNFDYSLDANGHPQNIYCRSDHYEYARYGIPVAFFTTGGHADYHQVTDEPQYIDYRNMAKVAILVQSAALRLANLGHRIAVDQPKPDPKGECKQ